MDNKNSQEIFVNLLKENRNGRQKGIYSVCSAHPEVLKACFMQAKADGSVLLVESTSNQVDQFGGYTGMKPADFVSFIRRIAAAIGFSSDKIILGGDHLGPNPWKHLPAEEAMEKAKVLIAEYIKAGYQKIHLDTSMFCADDEGDRSKPLSDEVVAKRTAILCHVAEDTWQKFRKGTPKPVYIIGTEVPIPGGAQEEEEGVSPTTPEDAEKTIAVTHEYFVKEGLTDAWERVVGLVVQPGVEFSDDKVFQYLPEKAQGLSSQILNVDRLVFEAHSTDYQSAENLAKLIEGHFCILKVGPWLTFAYREALFALEAMEVEIMGKDNGNLSKLSETLDNAMLKEPRFWKAYYHGSEYQQAFKRKYSFSDRSRYYWTFPEVDAAKEKLFKNLQENQIPLSLLSQFMPAQFYLVCSGKLSLDPKELVYSHIRTVAGMYSRACGFTKV
ncbi:D-tagatose-bisphosphate aldolase, class II, non-catalytic subunit [Thermophagus sp. OGC60D27]|uniref:D-tagatose-bisphosphate aldolase, class II, non-catalytic subunit n=1 Tax=Thermophagus sp. OGC60D27 TaxID=3458415 RepID=UPI004037D173